MRVPALVSPSNKNIAYKIAKLLLTANTINKPAVRQVIKITAATVLIDLKIRRIAKPANTAPSA